MAGGYKEAARWMADLMFLANNNAKKPRSQLYILLKDSYAAIGQLNRAAAACQRAILLQPQDQKLLKDLKRLRAKLGSGIRRGQVAASGASLCAAASRSPEIPRWRACDPGRAMQEGGGGGTGRWTPRVWRRPGPSFAKAREPPKAEQYDFAIDMYLERAGPGPGCPGGRSSAAVRAGLAAAGQGRQEALHDGSGQADAGQDARWSRCSTPSTSFVKDPDNLAYAEAMLKAAIEGGYQKTAHWIANLIFQTNNAVEKPSLQTYLVLKDSLQGPGPVRQGGGGLPAGQSHEAGGQGAGG